jgi:hypothetical protein
MLKQRNVGPNILSGTNAVHYVGVGGLGSGFANLPDMAFYPLQESIQSTYGNRKRYNLCEHTKTSKVYLDETFLYKTDPSPSSPSSYYNQNTRLLHQISANNGNAQVDDIVDGWFSSLFPGISPAVHNWRDNSARAVQAMWPKIEKDLDESLANNAYELPSLVKVLGLSGSLMSLANARDLSAGHTLKTLVGLGRINLGSSFLRGTLGTRFAVLKTLVGAAARALLIEEFCIRPLLADCSSVMTTIQQFERRIKNLLLFEGKILISHWSTPITGFPATSSYQSPGVWSIGSGTETYRPILGLFPDSAKYTASMRYQYRIDPWMRQHAHSLGMNDAFGLMSDPQILWNAIPFSFLVDYFAHVGNFLGQFKHRGLSPAVNILDFCHSIKLAYSGDLHLEVVCSPRTSYDKRLVHGRQVTYYLREPAIPGQVVPLEWRSLTKYKVFMMGALLGALRLK